MLKKFYRRLKREIRVYRLALRDERTPKSAKWLLRFMFVYLLSPLDLIPDAIPILGAIDDCVILPLLLLIVNRLIPKQVMADCRKQALEEMAA
ncbi:MAG: YkvA family protein [Terriglobia bacterium]